MIVENTGLDNITIVGTVHISPKTKKTIEKVINNKNPNVVAIELDEKRLDDMLKSNSDNTDFKEVNKFKYTFKTFLKKYYEFRYNQKFYSPGNADMLPAVNTGIKNNSDIALIDMHINDLKSNVKNNFYKDQSFRPSIFNLTINEIINEINNLIKINDDLSKKHNKSDIINILEDNNSDMEMIHELLDSVGELVPEIIDELIHERNKIMAGHLIWLDNNNQETVSVMGKGHVKGVIEYLNNPEEVTDYIVEPDWHKTKSINII